MADYDVTYDFQPQSGAGWTFSGPAGSGLQNPNTQGYWCWDSDATTSTGVGPLYGQEGNPEGYVYTEASGQTAPVTYTMTLSTGINGSLYSLNLSHYLSIDNDNESAMYVRVQAWDGGNWNTLYQYSGIDDSWHDGITWNWVLHSPSQHGTYNLSSYTNTDVKIRFIVYISGGTVWHNDIGIDTIRIYGNLRSGGVCTVAECTCIGCYECESCDLACATCDACQGTCVTCDKCNLPCYSCDICETCISCDVSCYTCENCDAACFICVACEGECVTCENCNATCYDCDACQSGCYACDKCDAACYDCNTCQGVCYSCDACDSCDECYNCQSSCYTCETCDKACNVCVSCEGTCVTCELCNATCDTCDSCQTCYNCQVCNAVQY